MQQLETCIISVRVFMHVFMRALASALVLQSREIRSRCPYSKRLHNFSPNLSSNRDSERVTVRSERVRARSVAQLTSAEQSKSNARLNRRRRRTGMHSRSTFRGMPSSSQTESTTCSTTLQMVKPMDFEAKCFEINMTSLSLIYIGGRISDSCKCCSAIQLQLSASTEICIHQGENLERTMLANFCED